MHVAIWYTGHPICDTVAQSLARGLNAELISTSAVTERHIHQFDCHIAYGILRGAQNVFRLAERYGKHWFNIDRGYLQAEHFSGYYRVSYRGTQARWPGKRYPLKNWRGTTLIVPPTDHVCEFFGFDQQHWIDNAIRDSKDDYCIRHKGEIDPVEWNNIAGVVTFNSSLGWQALAEGIPCQSDPTYSLVGSYFVDDPQDDVHSDCEQLFGFMRKNQFTLDEIERGLAWDLISSSVTTAEKPFVPMW